MRALGFLLLCAATATAEIKLAALFGHNMVLQADTKVAIWGYAKPREHIKIKYAGKSGTGKADQRGHWRVELGPLEFNEGASMTITGRVKKLTLRNVCVGEVWVCSGQSNMEWPVIRSANAQAEISGARDPLLRLYTVPKKVAGQPQADTAPSNWRQSNPDAVKGFSAVAYFFGRRLRHELDVPIGLIHSSWGGTPAEAWTRKSALESTPVVKPYLDRWDKILADYPSLFRKYEADFRVWTKKANKVDLKPTRWPAGPFGPPWDRKQPPPDRPRKPTGPDSPHRPAGLWNGMIAPLVPLAIRGVIWYQGESNANRADQYRTLFPLMIKDWRAAWGRGDFPFLFVQLANYQAHRKHVVPSKWAELRDAQRFARKEPNTGMAVTIDIGNPFNIHPKNKQEVGRRLALLAKAKAYGVSSPHSGPDYKDHSLDGPHMVIRFRHTNGGLKTDNSDPVRGFIIAGEDRKWRWAHARLEGDTVMVWHPLIPRPVAVRYAWADNPDCNLFNGEGLPAGPFRTDDWPGSTANNR